MSGGELVVHVLGIDRFGNLELDAGTQLADSLFAFGRAVELVLGAGGRRRAVYARTFADAAAGGLLLYVDARRQLALAVNQGSAAARLGLSVGDELRIRP